MVGRTMLAALLAALALVLVACGGDDDANGDASGEPTTTQTQQTQGAGGDDAAGDDATAGANAESCDALVELSREFGESFGAAGMTDGDVTDVAEAFRSFAGNAPEEIRADFETVSSAFTRYAEALEGVDLQSGQPPSQEALDRLEQVSQEIDEQELEAASNRIDQWIESECPEAS